MSKKKTKIPKFFRVESFETLSLGSLNDLGEYSLQ